MGSSKNGSNAILDKMFDLYVIQNKRYLIQDQFGKYNTITSGKVKCVPLLTYIMDKHMRQGHTVGVFSGVGYSKFICFDVDYTDREYAKWITYRIANILSNLGIHSYYVSFSGSKGYHLEIFFEDLIDLTLAKRFYNYVLKEAGIQKDSKGDVEFRPTDKQGVKLPLGIHQKSGEYCGFCRIEDGLHVLNNDESNKYLFHIKKISNKVIHNILERLLDTTEYALAHNKPAPKDINESEEAIAAHRNLSIYGVTEDSIIDSAISLLKNGLQFSGTRHISLFKIALYLKYLGNEREQTEQILNEWMEKQNKAFYKSDKTECHKDIQEIGKYIYSNDSTIVPKQKEVSITYSEVNSIIERCEKANNKLLTYAMLIHSKRYARKDGVFFMTFKQMTEATGLAESTVERNMNKLIDIGVIMIVERNRVQAGTHMKKPNLYRMTLVSDALNSCLDKMDVLEKQEVTPEDVYTTSDDIANKSIVACFNYYYNQAQLRKLLPRRQYNGFACTG